MRKYFLFLLLGFSTYGFAQNIAGTYAPNAHAATAWVNKASEYQKHELYDSAVYAYEQSSQIYLQLKDFGKYYESQSLLANSLASKGNTAKAKQILENIINQNQKYSQGRNKATADALYYLGISYYREENYDKELEYLEQALAIRKALYHPNDPVLSSTKSAIATAYSNKKNYDKALEYLYEVAQSREKMRDSGLMSSAYKNIASTYKHMGNYAKALEFYSKNLKALQQATQYQAHEKWGDAYNQIGDLYRLRAFYDSALYFFNKSREIHERFAGRESLPVANDLNSIGAVYNEQGQYDKAIETFEKALKMRKKVSKTENLEFSQLYNNFGAAFEAKKLHTQALEYHAKALEIRLKYLGEKHALVANSYNNIGISYQAMGEYNVALDNFMKSANIWREVNNKSIDLGTVYNNMGASYTQKGEYTIAQEYYEKSLLIRREILGNKHPEVATVYNNLGVISYFKGNYEEALRHYKMALDIRKIVLPKNHPDLITSYNNVGVSAYLQKELDLAIQYYDSALTIKVSVSGADHPSLAQQYNNIAAVYLEKRAYESAYALYEKALELRQREFGKKHPYVSSVYNNLGATAYQLQKYDESLQMFQKSLAANLESYSEDAPVTQLPILKGAADNARLFNALVGKAETFLRISEKNSKIENLQTAYAHLLAADTLLDQVRNQYVSEADKLVIASNVNKLTETALNVCQLLFYQTNQIAYYEKAFYFSEKSKSNVLLTSIAAKTFKGIPDHLLKEEQILVEDIKALEQQLLEEKSVQNLDSKFKLKAYQDQLFDLRRKYEVLIKNFENNYPEYYNLKYDVRIASVKDIQTSILKENPKAALVEFFATPEKIYMSVISKKGYDLLEVPAKDWEKQIRSLRNSMVYKIDEPYAEASYKLYEMLVLPIEKYFKANKINVNQLILVTDGLLSYLPFEALVTNRIENPKSIKYEGLNYLIKKYQISYGFSATLLYQSHNKKKFGENHYIAFAPVFDKKAVAKNLSLEEQEVDMKRGSSIASFFGFSASGITPLHATRKEVSTIEQMFQKKNFTATSYIAEKAHKKHIIGDRLSNYRYIHFATHGFVNESNPRYSGLLLTSENTESDDESILYVEEIYSLKLNADLVTLSACETGLGKVVRGEGIIGLTRGFLYAGTKNVVVSLWKVADNSTADLIIDFHANLLKKKSKSQALQMSKLKLLKSKQYSHPYFWSSFVLIGY